MDLQTRAEGIHERRECGRTCGLHRQFGRPKEQAHAVANLVVGHEYHLIDEFRGSPSRVNSGLSDQPMPLNLDGTPFHVDAPPPADAPKADDKAAPAADAKPEDKPADKPGVSKEKSALDKAVKKK